MAKKIVRGKIRKDRRTKALIPRLHRGEIALVAHENIDEVAARGLVEKKVKAVLNTEKSLTGKYVVRGAEYLLNKGVLVLDEVPREWMDRVVEGEDVVIAEDSVSCNGLSLESPQHLTKEKVHELLAQARESALKQLDAFVENTLLHLKKEKDWLFPDFQSLAVPFPMEGREVVIVVRGSNFKEDLQALSFFIKERKPVLLGVDGGADALREAKLVPDLVVGDMDSVSEESLRSARCVVAHAYPSGECPAKARLDQLGIVYSAVPYVGTSEDLALMIAYAGGANRIVGVGMHFSMDEFLQKGRAGMASTLLARMRVGSILFDAKGVSEIYQPAVPRSAYILLYLSALFVVSVTLISSPYISPFFRLFRLYLKQILGEF